MNGRTRSAPDIDIGVAVIGVGGTELGRPRTEVSLQEMVFEGTTNVLKEAEITREEVDSVVLSASDLIDGRGIASMSSGAAAGAHMKHESRTTNDGIYALALAALEIWAGRSRVALVMCWSKMSETSWAAIPPTMFEPFYERPVGMDNEAAQGLAANALLLDAARAGDSLKPAAMLGRKSDEFAGRAYRGTPPGEYDGAYGMVLADIEIARRSGRPYAVLEGISWGAGPRLQDREHPYDAGLSDVAARAYRSAGVRHLDEIDVIEMIAKSEGEEVALLDSLVKPLGSSHSALVRRSEFGRLPINPSGGFGGLSLMQGAGLMAAGEIVRQVTGKAGGHQIAGARRGIAHGQSGPAAQGGVVAVFSSADGGR